MIVLFTVVACTSNNQYERREITQKGDTCQIETYQIDGLWLEKKQKYETTFVFIENDTIYFLKGPADKYYLRHDTLHLIGRGRFQRKIINVDSIHLLWVSNSKDTFLLSKKF